jgi:hypothetical protein
VHSKHCQAAPSPFAYSEGLPLQPNEKHSFRADLLQASDQVTKRRTTRIEPDTAVKSMCLKYCLGFKEIADEEVGGSESGTGDAFGCSRGEGASGGGGRHCKTARGWRMWTTREGDRSSSLSSLDGYLERCNTATLSLSLVFLQPLACAVLLQIFVLAGCQSQHPFRQSTMASGLLPVPSSELLGTSLFTSETTVYNG